MFPQITDPLWEVLHVEVWDYDMVGAHDFMGMVEIGCGELVELLRVPAGADYALGVDSAHPRDVVSGTLRFVVSKVTELISQDRPRPLVGVPDLVTTDAARSAMKDSSE